MAFDFVFELDFLVLLFERLLLLLRSRFDFLETLEGLPLIGLVIFRVTVWENEGSSSSKQQLRFMKCFLVCFGIIRLLFKFAQFYRETIFRGVY